MKNSFKNSIFAYSLSAFLTLLLLPISIYADESAWLIESVKTNYVLDRDFNQPKESEIIYKNGHVAKGDFVDFEVIDFFDTNEKVKFILFSAKACFECDANPSIYVNAVSDNNYGASRFDYPGKLKSFQDNQVVSVSRMFYGECLAKPENALLIYSTYLDAKNEWQKKLQIWHFIGSKIVQKEAEITQEMTEETEASLEAGQCFEVFGIDGYTEP